MLVNFMMCIKLPHKEPSTFLPTMMSVVPANGNVTYERTFAKKILTLFVMVHMARTSGNAINMFSMFVDRLPKSVSDLNGNDNYAPKEDIMGSERPYQQRPKTVFSPFDSPMSWKQGQTSENSGCK